MAGDKEEKKYIPVPLLPIPFFTRFDEFLIDFLPEEYKGVADHYINAKIEFLKSIEEIVKVNIERLEGRREELATKKEKVDVE